MRNLKRYRNLFAATALLLLIAALSLTIGAQNQPLFSTNAKYIGFGFGGGTANAQTVTYTPAITSYSDGQVVSWLPTVANTGAATLNISGLGAKSLVKANGAALIANDLITTAKAIAIYDAASSSFELQNAQSVTGSVTSISTGTGLTGGPITGSGTISMTTVQTVRDCQLNFGAKNSTALVTADIQPQDALCDIPAAATVTLVIVYVDAGASTVVVSYRHNGSTTAITPTLTPASVGGITDPVACANTGGTAVTLQGNSVTCSTLSNTTLTVHDVIETTAGTADGTSKHMSVAVEWTVN